MKFTESHVSAAGGVFNAPLNAQAIGATAFAMSTKNQSPWTSPPFSDETIEKFHRSFLVGLIGKHP